MLGSQVNRENTARRQYVRPQRRRYSRTRLGKCILHIWSDDFEFGVSSRVILTNPRGFLFKTIAIVCYCQTRVNSQEINWIAKFPRNRIFIIIIVVIVVVACQNVKSCSAKMWLKKISRWETMSNVILIPYPEKTDDVL